MIDKIKRIVQDNFPFLVIFFMVLFFEIVFYQRTGDELTIYNSFLAQYGTFSLKNFILFLVAQMKRDILYWSSRTIIDFVSLSLIFCVPLWKVFNAAVYAVLVKSLCSIFNLKKNEYIILVVALIGLIPQTIYLSAGWLMTSIAYLWPVAAAIMAVDLMFQSEEEINWKKILISVLLIMFAANEEIMCAVLLVVFPLLAYNEKKYKKQCLILEGIVVLEMLWTMFCPGNQGRSLAEQSRWFVDFSSLSIIKKMDLGFSTTMREYLGSVNMIFIVLSTIICILGIKKTKNILARGITSVPLVAAVLGLVLEKIYLKSNLLTEWYNSPGRYGTVSMYNYNEIKTYLPLFLYVFVGGCVLLSILIIGENTREACALVIVMLIGVASRCAMGFSPTVWASGNRTFSILYFIFLFSILAGIKKMLQWKMKTSLQLVTLLISIGSMIEISNFIMCFK